MLLETLYWHCFMVGLHWERIYQVMRVQKQNLSCKSKNPSQYSWLCVIKCVRQAVFFPCSCLHEKHLSMGGHITWKEIRGCSLRNRLRTEARSHMHFTFFGHERFQLTFWGNPFRLWLTICLWPVSSICAWLLLMAQQNRAIQSTSFESTYMYLICK